MKVDPSLAQSLVLAHAHLYYAVSASDMRLPVDERRVIKELLDQLIEIQGTADAAEMKEQAYALLRELIGNHVSALDGFKHYASFYSAHSEVLGDDYVALTYEACDRIANAVAGRNKGEVVILSKLKQLFIKSAQ